jgi:hypothetical protein
MTSSTRSALISLGSLGRSRRPINRWCRALSLALNANRSGSQWDWTVSVTAATTESQIGTSLGRFEQTAAGLLP